MLPLGIDWIVDGQPTGPTLILLVGGIMALCVLWGILEMYWDDLPWSAEYQRLKRKQDIQAQKELREFCRAEGLPWIDSEIPLEPAVEQSERVTAVPSRVGTPRVSDHVTEPLRRNTCADCGLPTWAGKSHWCHAIYWKPKYPKPLISETPKTSKYSHTLDARKLSPVKAKFTDSICWNCVTLTVYGGTERVLPCSECRTLSIPKGCTCFYEQCRIHKDN